MARKKATPPPEEIPEVNEQLEGEQPPVEEMPSGEQFVGDPSPGDSQDAVPAAETDMNLFAAEPENPFPAPESEDAALAPPVEDDPNVLDGSPAPDALPEGEADTEATEGYGELLSELSEAAGEDPQAEDAPLLLSEEQIGNTAKDDGKGELSERDRQLLEEDVGPSKPNPPAHRPRPAPAPYRRNDRVLTINARDEVETDAEREATLWHNLQNSYLSRHILTGKLDGVEQKESGLTVAIVSYNGFRVVIPAKEMLISNDRRVNGLAYAEMMDVLARRLNARMGGEIDFIVKGIEKRTRSVVASRKDAMYRKRRIFYMDRDATGQPMIYEGRIVQARVVAVTEKIIRVEAFGVECSIRGGDISRAYYGNANEEHRVGDKVLVRIRTIQCPSVENLSITADIRSVTPDDSSNLKNCVKGGRYVGRVTGYQEGQFFLRLNNGGNAVAHDNRDLRSPGKNDDVSFLCTRIEPWKNHVGGIITRIIRQNL